MKSSIVWFEIPTLDLDRAVKFYSDVLKMSINVRAYMGMNMGFYPMEQDGDVGGGIMPPIKENAPSRTGTRVYFGSEEKLEDVLARVEPAGGKIISGKMALAENMGYIALIEDTEGNTVGLFSRN